MLTAQARMPVTNLESDLATAALRRPADRSQRRWGRCPRASAAFDLLVDALEQVGAPEPLPCSAARAPSAAR